MALMLILTALAVYRLSTDLAWESGPFDIYARMRGWVIAHGPRWMAEGVSCPICWSFWLSLVALYWGPIEWLGIAGAVAFVARLTTHDSD